MDIVKKNSEMKNSNSSLESLRALTSVLEKHKKLVNACMVDFITNDLFSSLVDPDVGTELIKMSEQELQGLPQLFIRESKTLAIDGSKYPNVMRFGEELAGHTLDVLGVSVSRTDFLEKHLGCKDDGQDLLRFFDRFMSDKKMHEVVFMSNVVLELASKYQTETLLDLGSGKAYLSQVVAAQAQQPDMKVLAVDSSSTNSNSATKRSQKLEKFWGGLIRRAKYRREEKTPPPRGKHWKGRRGLDQTQETEDEKSNSKDSSVGDRLKFVTQFVDTETDFQSLLKENFDLDGGTGKERIGMIGLHTCGNLAPDSLRIFLSNNDIKFVCNVGCCYHHLHEEFYTNPYMSPQEVNDRQTNPRFPLSKFLREKKFELGKNALMVAAQPMDRLLANLPLPSDSLLWRAILQVILKDHKPNIKFEEQHVGRTAKKSNNFVSYVHKSFEKLNIELKISDDEIDHIYRKFAESHRQKLLGYYQLKSMLGPLIEGIILLDRLQWLLEQV